MSISLVILTIIPSVIFALRSTSPQISKLPLAVVIGSLYSLANYWEGLVTKNVPEPYLDEVFHIPQAQAYCKEKYEVWDPKITTPPGLYVFASLKAFLLQGMVRSSSACSVHDLRSLNCLALCVMLVLAYACRLEIIRSWKQPKEVSTDDTLHTAFNIVLFPPLFFYSGLFYTDILSACFILIGYWLFLWNRRTFKKAHFYAQLWIYIFGIISLTVRQTNVFWVVVFLGASEFIPIRPSRKDPNNNTQSPEDWLQLARTRLKQYSDGQVHDVQLSEADARDFILCAVSMAVAAASRPALVAKNLWPYIGLLFSFGGFVLWNEGVALGDKSNHIATIHFAQMLYIWPLIVFFSAPLILPSGLNFLSVVRNSYSSSTIPWTFKRLYRKATNLFILLIGCLLIIRYNTIIHPFTLADNRHYMFYVFRYTILRSPLVRFFLAPIYFICGYLIYLIYTPPLRLESTNYEDTTTYGSDSAKISLTLDGHQGPSTAFVLILFASTSLSLISTTLVEPRYFIIPWILWRLNVPFLSSRTVSYNPGEPGVSETPHHKLEIGNSVAKSYSYSLWLETIWFFTINLATAFVFLFKGFEWPQEPGKVQRFIW